MAYVARKLKKPTLEQVFQKTSVACQGAALTPRLINTLARFTL